MQKICQFGSMPILMCKQFSKYCSKLHMNNNLERKAIRISWYSIKMIRQICSFTIGVRNCTIYIDFVRLDFEISQDMRLVLALLLSLAVFSTFYCNLLQTLEGNIELLSRQPDFYIRLEMLDFIKCGAMFYFWYKNV